MLLSLALSTNLLRPHQLGHQIYTNNRSSLANFFLRFSNETYRGAQKKAVRPEGRTAGKIQSTFNKKPLQVETDAKLVDVLLVVAVGGVGRQEVEVDFETRGEDEPAALGSDGDIAAEAVEFSPVG